jgi:hypothetical protein
MRDYSMAAGKQVRQKSNNRVKKGCFRKEHPFSFLPAAKIFSQKSMSLFSRLPLRTGRYFCLAGSRFPGAIVTERVKEVRRWQFSGESEIRATP